MPPHAASPARPHPSMRGIARSIVTRLSDAARRWRASDDVPRLMDRWIEARRTWDCAGWVLRGHPSYQFTFTRDVRGQTVRAYMDFHAELGLLGLFLYWPARIDTKAVESLYAYINRMNWECSTGCLEIDPEDGTLRYRAALDTRGARLTTGFLDRMLESGIQALERHARRFLTGPTGIAASN